MSSTVANIITAIGYNLDLTIDTSSEPSQAELIEWMNQDIDWILAICAEEGSDIGQTTGSISAVDGTSSYATLASDMYAPDEYAYIETATTRTEINLTSKKATIGYSPGAANEGQPARYYIDGSNNIILLPTPDNSYTIKLPYWQLQTALTATTDTVPFQELFDNIIIQSGTVRAQNRDEYNIEFEQSWLNFLTERVRNLIRMRINTRQRIMVSRSKRFVSENVRAEIAAAPQR